MDITELVRDTIALAVHTPFMAEEVEHALRALACRKSTGSVVYLVDVFQGL